MKRLIKKIVSTVLACAVAAGMTQGMVFAETTVAKINEKPFETLQEAVNEAQAGETIVLVADTNENVKIEAGKDLPWI